MHLTRFLLDGHLEFSQSFVKKYTTYSDFTYIFVSISGTICWIYPSSSLENSVKVQVLLNNIWLALAEFWNLRQSCEAKTVWACKEMKGAWRLSGVGSHRAEEEGRDANPGFAEALEEILMCFCLQESQPYEVQQSFQPRGERRQLLFFSGDIFIGRNFRRLKIILWRWWHHLLGFLYRAVDCGWTLFLLRNWSLSLQVKEHLCIYRFPFNHKWGCRATRSDEFILCLVLRVQVAHLVSSIFGLVHLCPVLILLSCSIAVGAAIGAVPRLLSDSLRESVQLFIPWCVSWGLLLTGTGDWGWTSFFLP